MYEESKVIAKTIINCLENKKAENIQIIDISEVSSLGDFFIIANGNNRSQIQALSDHVEETLGKQGVSPKQIEGYTKADWILLDYRDVIIHIFDKDARDYYDIERIWRDGNIITKEEL